MAEIRGDWPGTTPNKNPSTVEEDLKKRLSDADFKPYLDALRTAGCADDRLFELLVRIRRSGQWKKVTKAEVKQAAKMLAIARDAVLRLKESELGRHIFERLSRADLLADELDWVQMGAEQHVGSASGKKKPRSDSAIEALVRYVKEKSGRYFDSEVSGLLTSTLGLDGTSPEGQEVKTAPSLRKWRNRRGLSGSD